MSTSSFASLDFKTIVPNPPPDDSAADTALIEIEALNLFYGTSQALKNIDLAVRERRGTAPSVAGRADARSRAGRGRRGS